MSNATVSNKVKAQSAFTLIELLVAIGILSVIAGVGVTIFLSISSAYNKSLIINELQREGSRVMEEMGRVVKAAQNASCEFSCPSSILVLTIDDETLEYQQNGNCETVKFKKESGAPSGSFVKKELSGGTCSPRGAGAITDTDSSSGADVEVLSFSVTEGGGDPDVVSIRMKLRQAVGAPSRGEYKAEVELTSKVSTRAY